MFAHNSDQMAQLWVITGFHRENVMRKPDADEINNSHLRSGREMEKGLAEWTSLCLSLTVAW